MKDKQQLFTSDIIQYAILTFMGVVLVMLLRDYLPEYIPNTPIKIDGVLLGSWWIILLRWAIRDWHRAFPNTTIASLTLKGIFFVFIGEILFQSLRQLVYLSGHTTSDRIYFFLLGVIGISLMCTIFAFLIAYHVKTRNTKRLVFMIIGITLIFNLLQKPILHWMQ